MKEEAFSPIGWWWRSRCGCARSSPRHKWPSSNNHHTRSSTRVCHHHTLTCIASCSWCVHVRCQDGGRGSARSLLGIVHGGPCHPHSARVSVDYSNSCDVVTPPRASTMRVLTDRRCSCLYRQHTCHDRDYRHSAVTEITDNL